MLFNAALSALDHFSSEYPTRLWLFDGPPDLKPCTFPAPVIELSELCTVLMSRSEQLVCPGVQARFLNKIAWCMLPETLNGSVVQRLFLRLTIVGGS